MLKFCPQIQDTWHRGATPACRLLPVTKVVVSGPSKEGVDQLMAKLR